MSTNTLYNQQIFATYFTPSPNSGIGIDPKEILNAQLADSLAVLVLSILAIAAGFWVMKLCFDRDGDRDTPDTGGADLLAMVLIVGGLLPAVSEVRTISKVIFSPNVVIYEATKSLTK